MCGAFTVVKIRERRKMVIHAVALTTTYGNIPLRLRSDIDDDFLTIQIHLYWNFVESFEKATLYLAIFALAIVTSKMVLLIDGDATE